MMTPFLCVRCGMFQIVTINFPLRIFKLKNNRKKKKCANCINRNMTKQINEYFTTMHSDDIGT